MATKQQQPRPRLTPDVPANEQVERAVVALVMASGRSWLIENLEANDFYHPLTRFVFSELRRMWESGEPLGDVHALTRWFRQPQCRRRSREAHVEVKPEEAAGVLAEIASEYATVAHEGYYVRVLRQARLQRGLVKFALDLLKEVRENPLTPVATANWGQEQFDRIWAHAAEWFPEEINA